jgi:hypothetical protein
MEVVSSQEVKQWMEKSSETSSMGRKINGSQVKKW